MKALKSFAVAFAASAIILGIIAAFVTGAVEDIILGVFERKTDDLSSILNNTTDDVVSGDKESEEGKENKLINLSGESYSMLLVCTDYRPKVYKDYAPKAAQIKENKDGEKLPKDGFRVTGPSNICLVNCSKETGEFVFTPISPNTNVYTGSGHETLHDIYGHYGFEFFLSKVESITGVTVDYYAVINCTDISTVVDTIGAVYCTVPCDIFTDGKEYVGTTQVSREEAIDSEIEFKEFLEPCTDYIGPSSMGLLLFRDYSNGIDDELAITEGYAKGILRNFAKLSPEGQATVWSRMTAVMSHTNITDDFFTKNGALTSAFNDDICTSVVYPGNFRLAGEANESTFEPFINKGVEALSKYR